VYINPFTNLFFYVSGLAIYYNLGGRKIHPVATVVLLALSLAAVIYYPVAGDRITLVTGINRIIFSLGSVFVVWLFYSSRVKLPKVATLPLSVLGLATYGIYLIHPVVFQYGIPQAEAQLLARFGINATGGENYRYLAMVTTVTIAIISFYTFETFFQKLGKVATKRFK
jgi:peptidoglycan/LPS O-acetylase OafA/YrhL